MSNPFQTVKRGDTVYFESIVFDTAHAKPLEIDVEAKVLNVGEGKAVVEYKDYFTKEIKHKVFAFSQLKTKG
jgi:hypothetical protein